MDTSLIEVYGKMLKSRFCSVDDILCEPELRQEFLSEARHVAGSELLEDAILKRLTNLRKRKKLPRKEGR